MTQDPADIGLGKSALAQPGDEVQHLGEIAESIHHAQGRADVACDACVVDAGNVLIGGLSPGIVLVVRLGSQAHVGPDPYVSCRTQQLCHVVDVVDKIIQCRA